MINPNGRFIFRGTFGQTALLVSAALLVAQGLAFFLLINERDRWRLLDAVQPAVERFATVLREVEKHPQAQRFQTALVLSRPEEHFIIAPKSLVSGFHLTRQADLETRLASALPRQNNRPRAIEASSIGFADSPPQNRMHPPFGPDAIFGPPPDGHPVPIDGSLRSMHLIMRHHRLHDANRQEIDLAVRLDDGTWLNGQFLSMRPSAALVGRFLLAELILFAIVLTVALVLAMRLARPMMRLATAADNLRPDRPPDPVPESGPSDIRAAIRSFNAMIRRISDLLREKDRMLGAIGHDLRTPLASLRIRAEAVESEADREKMIETIDDMTRMVDEILDLARIGRSGEAFAMVELGALADSVVEEFRDLRKDVTYLDGPRVVRNVQPFLMRRMLRNLIENGLKFGDCVRVTVQSEPPGAALLVMDDGPGIPPDKLETVLEPFSRVEDSRSRETGGTGLGLSIAAGIARMQGAEIVLENRNEGGLTVRILWPAAH